MELGWFEAALNVADIARSLAFYETLGFEVVDGGVDVRYVTVRKGDCRLGLFQGHLEPPRPQLIFWQGDVAAIVGALEGQGLRFDAPPATSPGGEASARLKDPDGHPLFFIFMPVHLPHSERHARPLPAYSPGAAFYPPAEPRPGDLDFGWFEISLDVADMARATAFYRKLGFALVDDSVERTATLQSGDCRIGLYHGYLKPARTQLIFWQGDVEAIARHLTAKGLRLDGPNRDDKGVGAMLFDPDGHPLYFVNIRGVTRNDG